MMRHYLLFTLFCFANANEIFYYQDNQKKELTPIETKQKLQKQDNNQTNSVKYYKTPNNITVGVSREIIVKIKKDTNIDSLLNKYQVLLKQELLPKLYVVETNSTKETIEISNRLYLDENVSYAHPNFIKKIQKR